MRWYQRWTEIALASLLALVLMGAIVRVTGSGLGCPDWPKCWGCLLPPTQTEQVDISRINIEKFRRKAARLGRNPEELTHENILQSFNPTHAWLEYINRLFSLPITISSIALLISAFLLPPQTPQRKTLGFLAISSVSLVMANALLGAKVVYSGLQPGIITLHLALAILLLCVLVIARWISQQKPHVQASPQLKICAVLLFSLIIAEGILGAQVREATDALAFTHSEESRAVWAEILESKLVYLVHRSFSWGILLVAFFAYLATKVKTWLTHSIMLLILGQMILGVILSNSGVHPVAQALHVLLASILLVFVFHWNLLLFSKKADL